MNTDNISDSLLYQDQDTSEQETSNNIENIILEARQKWELIQKQYMNTHTEEDIYTEIKEVISSISLQDFKDSLEDLKQRLPLMITTDSINLKIAEYQTRENYFNACDYISKILSFYLGAIQKYKPTMSEQIDNLIDEKILTWYTAPTPEEVEEFISTYSGKERILQLNPSRITSIIVPVDKITSKMFALPEIISNENMKFITGQNKKTKEEVGIIVNLRFEAPGQSYSYMLTGFDKLVYIAVSSLYYAGFNNMTLTMIYKAMGNTKAPSKNQLQRIDNSLNKMRVTIMKLDNSEEIAANMKYVKVVYDEALLNFKGIEVKVKGKQRRAIHLEEAPVLLRFATARKQIATVSQILLEDPLRNDEDNIKLKNYLIVYLNQAKENKKLQRKLLFSTLCKECGVTDKNQRQRLKAKIIRLMSFYKDNNFVSDFFLDKDNNLHFEV